MRDKHEHVVEAVRVGRVRAAGARQTPSTTQAGRMTPYQASAERGSVWSKPGATFVGDKRLFA